MAKPRYYVLVCGNKRPEGHPKGSCSDRGFQAVLDKIFEVMDREQLKGKVKIIRTASCMGPCSAGSTIGVFPDDIWYGRMKPGYVEEIFDQHLKKGKPLKRLFIPEEAF